MRSDKSDDGMQTNLGNYSSVPEFIYGITREICEDRGIGAKRDKYYTKDILLRAAAGFENPSNRCASLCAGR